MVFGQINKIDDGKHGKENFLLPVPSIGGEIEISDMMEDLSENARSFRTDDDNPKRFKPHKSFDQDCDLYGDLEGAVFSPAKRVLSIPEKEALELQLEQANKEIEELKERITVLSRENLNLQNNFASLLKTAKQDKEKNIFTLRELRIKLKHATQLHAQKLQLPKEEIREILNYCNEVEYQLQSRISLDIVREALREMKTEKPKKIVPKQKWAKCIRLDDNISFYIAKEQVPFKRLESVKFPKSKDQNQKIPVQSAASNKQVSPEEPPRVPTFLNILQEGVPEKPNKPALPENPDSCNITKRNSASSKSSKNQKEPDRRPSTDGSRNRSRSRSPHRRRTSSRNRRRSRSRSNHRRNDSRNISKRRSRSRSVSRDRRNHTRSSQRRQSNR